MIKNEEYIDYLQKIIACVSNGDYYSIKELSVLKLDDLRRDTIKMKKELNKYVKTNKCQNKLNKIDREEIKCFMNQYIDYVFNKIKENKELKEIASIEEFIESMHIFLNDKIIEKP